MNNRVSPSTNISTVVEWMWKSNKDPWNKSEVAEWSHFSDVENFMIEEAFTAKQAQLVLDDYYIDFKHCVQISTNNKKQQRPIKREVNKRTDKHLREERFIGDPIAPVRPHGRQYGWISPFIREAIIDLQLTDGKVPSQDETILPMIVEKAALGIIEEGKILGKRRVAEWMAQELINQKDKGIKEVWMCCARLYSIEEFLYKKLNEVMRLIGSDDHEEIWRSKVRTMGPFALLLWDDPINKEPKTSKIKLYRGATLSQAQIDHYQYLCQHPDEYGSFQAFTSCSINRTKAETFGNVLFAMEVDYGFTADLRKISEYPEEDEELVFPGICFTVQRVEYNKINKKHLIYIQLTQRFNGAYELN